MDLWAQLTLLSLAGAASGCLTGLLPSLHVNTLAVILLAVAPLLAVALPTLGLDAFPGGFYVSAFILAISLAHTYVNIVPAAYLGAPDESTALSVLPAHKLLLRGLGYRAVELSTLASHWATLASVALALPFAWLLGPPVNLFEPIRANLFWIVLTLAVALVLFEPARIGPERWSPVRRRSAARCVALALLAASSVYGLLVFRIPYTSVVPLPPSPLLPALSGLFGAATILTALDEPAKLPHQFLRLNVSPLRARGAVVALGAGVLAGATMSVLPGLTNSSANALATTFRKGTEEETLVSVSAVNTANVVFNLAVLYLFFRSRSGAVVAMQELWPVRAWRGTVPADLAWFGFVILAAGLASTFLTLWIGRWGVRRVQRVPYHGLLWAVLAYMALVVALFSGPTGLLVFVIGTTMGILPAKLGLRRTSLTGVLLGPVLWYLWPFASGTP